MNKKVVVLGGGTGLSFLMKALKHFPVDITAIITVADDGKSTGKLRSEFNIPAVGDIRKVIYNLSEIDDDIKKLMEYRFTTSSDLNGHALGNLILVGMLSMTGSLKASIGALTKLLDVKHTVLPLSEDSLVLMGETVDGDIVEGEDNIPKARKKYRRLFYKSEPKVLPEVIEAIKSADLVLLSMGSLYTSLVPNLICKDVQKAIKDSHVKVIYLCNAMTQPGETDEFSVSDHLKVLTGCLGDGIIDAVIVANSEVNSELLDKYRIEEGKYPVVIDREEIEKMNIEIIENDLLTIEDGTIKHDGLKLGSIIFSYMMRK